MLERLNVLTECVKMNSESTKFGKQASKPPSPCQVKLELKTVNITRTKCYLDMVVYRFALIQ